MEKHGYDDYQLKVLEKYLRENNMPIPNFIENQIKSFPKEEITSSCYQLITICQYLKENQLQVPELIKSELQNCKTVAKQKCKHIKFWKFYNRIFLLAVLGGFMLIRHFSGDSNLLYWSFGVPFSLLSAFLWVYSIQIMVYESNLKDIDSLKLG